MLQSTLTSAGTSRTAIESSTRPTVPPAGVQPAAPPPWSRTHDIALKPYPPVQTAAPDPQLPDTLYFKVFDRILNGQDPDALDHALASITRRGGNMSRHALHSHVFATLDATDDPSRAARLTRAASGLGTTPSALLDEAVRFGDAKLAMAAIHMDPSIVNAARFDQLLPHMPHVARVALAENSSIANAVGWSRFGQVMARPLLRAGVDRQATPEETIDRCLALLRAFPKYAADISRLFFHQGIIRAALEVAPLPHSYGFWSNAVRNIPHLLQAEFTARPELVTIPTLRALIKQNSLALLASACQANPAMVNQRDRDGNTAAHFAAAYLRTAALDTLLANGARGDQPNRQGITPAQIAAGQYTTLQ
jgi:hypothetical protein